MTQNEEPSDNLIKLYAILIDQLQSYNNLIWQIPAALVVANFVALDSSDYNPWACLALAVFNGAMVYAFYKMVVRQRSIVIATKAVERRLSEDYGDGIPKFRKHKISAPRLVLGVLAALDLLQLAYALALVLGIVAPP